MSILAKDLLIGKAQKYQAEDKKRKEGVTIKNDADPLIYIKDSIAEALKEAFESDNLDEIKSKH